MSNYWSITLCLSRLQMLAATDPTDDGALRHVISATELPENVVAAVEEALWLRVKQDSKAPSTAEMRTIATAVAQHWGYSWDPPQNWLTASRKKLGIDRKRHKIDDGSLEVLEAFMANLSAASDKPIQKNSLDVYRRTAQSFMASGVTTVQAAAEALVRETNSQRRTVLRRLHDFLAASSSSAPPTPSVSRPSSPCAASTAAVTPGAPPVRHATKRPRLPEQVPGGAGEHHPLGRIQACAEQARPRPSLILAVHANESRPPASALGLSTGEKDTVPGMPAGEVFSFVSRIRGPGTGELVFEGNDGPKFIAAQKLVWACVRSRAAQLRRLVGFQGAEAEQDLGAVSVYASTAPDNCSRDGLSAGLMFAASFLSLATGLPVVRRAAFTGAVDLRGRVSSVDGLISKTQAALKAGVELLVCHEDDVAAAEAAVPEGVQLRVVGIRTLADLPRHALHLPPGLDQQQQQQTQGSGSTAPSDMCRLEAGFCFGCSYMVHQSMKRPDPSQAVQEFKISQFRQELQGRRTLVNRGPCVLPMLGHAIDWLASLPREQWASEGMALRPGLDTARLLTDYDVVLYFPPMGAVHRDETWCSGAIYLAMMSAATGIEMDPTVSVIGGVHQNGTFIGWDRVGIADVSGWYIVAAIATVIVPESALSMCLERFKELLSCLGPSHQPRKFRIVGAANVWAAAKYAFRSSKQTPVEEHE